MNSGGYVEEFWWPSKMKSGGRRDEFCGLNEIFVATQMNSGGRLEEF